MFIFHKKLVIILAILLIAGVYFYFHLGFYFGKTVRDSDNNFKKLSEVFIPQVDRKYLGSYNGYSYQHRDGSWEIVQSGVGVSWYANFIDTGDTYQRVMRMRYVQDLSLHEISLITGQTKNTVAVQAHRGLEKLKLLYNPV